MKSLALIISLVTICSLGMYGQSENVKELLGNQETRNEVFNSILNDHEMMKEFIQVMKNNPHAMMMMQGDSATMGSSSMPVMHGKGMHKMMDTCEIDSTRCHKMTGKEGEHPHMMDKSMKTMMKPDGSQGSEVKHIPHN